MGPFAAKQSRGTITLCWPTQTQWGQARKTKESWHIIKNGNFLPFQHPTAPFASQQGGFLLPSVSKAAKKPFSVATFSKIQLDYPKEFCQFFQGCKFGLACSFLGHWSRICLFWRIALLLLTTFCGTLKTIFKVAITKNQNYAITAFLFTLSFFPCSL